MPNTGFTISTQSTGETKITGDRDGLLQLRSLIDKAIDTGKAVWSSTEVDFDPLVIECVTQWPQQRA